MVGKAILLLLGLCLSDAATVYQVNPHKCYTHDDHAAKYQLSHNRNGYPLNEINLILEKHPEMKSMFYDDNNPLTAPASTYDPAPISVCPYHRYNLYSFFNEGKDCYVVYPDVQKVMYVQCSNDHNRDCQQCSAYGGVSKCEEDYDYRYVWAYCTHRPAAKNIHRSHYDVPVHQHQLPAYQQIPQQWESPSVQRSDRNPVFIPARNNVISSIGSVYRDPWSRMMYRPILVHTRQSRWKRSYHTVEPHGNIERMKLYLPHHCGCKRFIC